MAAKCHFAVGASWSAPTMRSAVLALLLALQTIRTLHVTPRLGLAPRPAPCPIARGRRCAAPIAQNIGQSLPENTAEARVMPTGCESCEAKYLATSKQAEADEQERLVSVRASNFTQFIEEIHTYAQHMNNTQRQELALTPDCLLRNFIIDSSTAPTPLMERVYNATMQRVPYESACYICGPEQAMLMRTLVGLARPRRALDIGSFTGYGSSGIAEALPADGELICLEAERDFTRLAASTLRGRNVNFMVGKAMDALVRFEQEGRQFDFIALDADKPMHGEYYNMSLKLLRPGGVMIMFGMLLFPTLEDQEAMEALHKILPNDTRISTAQLPVGCGIQLMVSAARAPPPTLQPRRPRAHAWKGRRPAHRPAYRLAHRLSHRLAHRPTGEARRHRSGPPALRRREGRTARVAALLRDGSHRPFHRRVGRAAGRRRLDRPRDGGSLEQGARRARRRPARRRGGRGGGGRGGGRGGCGDGGRSGRAAGASRRKRCVKLPATRDARDVAQCVPYNLEGAEQAEVARRLGRGGPGLLAVAGRAVGTQRLCARVCVHAGAVRCGHVCCRV